MHLLAQAAEDGFIERNGDIFDIFCLVALILFVIAAFIAWSVQPRLLWATVIAAGLASTAFAFLFL